MKRTCIREIDLISKDIAKKKRWVIDRRVSPPAGFGSHLYNFSFCFDFEYALFFGENIEIEFGRLIFPGLISSVLGLTVVHGGGKYT
jgi:hypothetical protein